MYVPLFETSLRRGIPNLFHFLDSETGSRAEKLKEARFGRWSVHRSFLAERDRSTWTSRSTACVLYCVCMLKINWNTYLHNIAPLFCMDINNKFRKRETLLAMKNCARFFPLFSSFSSIENTWSNGKPPSLFPHRRLGQSGACSIHPLIRIKDRQKVDCKTSFF